MIKGMTGFGLSQFSVGETKGVVEVKSVNHRYFDASFYLPNGFGVMENKIRPIVQSCIQRGRVTVALKIIQKPSQAFSLSKPAVRQYVKYAQTMKKEFKLQGELQISDLIHLPGVVEVKETALNPERLRPTVEKALRKALAGLSQMRKREGKSLWTDLTDKLKRMRSQIKKIEGRTQVISRAKRKVLNEEEFLSFQKGSDVNEELSRLAHYVEEFKLLLKTNSSVGKKLDFIAQEMQRETNTIGSKVQDKIVSNAVIALKSKIEKIREQAQNIE